jgi:hypothetical protein
MIKAKFLFPKTLPIPAYLTLGIGTYLGQLEIRTIRIIIYCLVNVLA